MKKTFTLNFAALLLSVIALLIPQQTIAQEDDGLVGYANVFIRVKAVPEGGGKVFPFYQEATTKVWRDQWDFSQPVPVGSMFDTYFTMIYLYANPATTDGYIFAGWFLDDGDGVFDAEKDEFLSESLEYLSFADIDPDETPVYETQSAARSGEKPTEATDLIFAYFTKGARVNVAYYQDSEYDFHGNCGSVWISKTVNEPGDQVIVRALPNDGYHFAYWANKSQLGDPVSTENPYTFTVQGGEQLYAYFMADDAPTFDLPEEGGFAVASFYDEWVLSDESLKNGAAVLFLEAEDLTRTADGKVYLDMTNEGAADRYSQWRYAPTLIYGKGKVTFAYKIGIGFGSQLLQWSGDNGVSVGGDVIYVYVFVPELGAFIQYGTTDDYNVNATETVKVPAKMIYFSMSAYDLTDNYGNIPTVIGLSPETYDKGMAGYNDALNQLAAIEGVKMGETTLRGQKVYTLSGVEVKTTSEKGVFIVNGKKMILK